MNRIQKQSHTSTENNPSYWCDGYKVPDCQTSNLGSIPGQVSKCLKNIFCSIRLIRREL